MAVTVALDFFAAVRLKDVTPGQVNILAEITDIAYSAATKPLQQVVANPPGDMSNISQRGFPPLGRRLLAEERNLHWPIPLIGILAMKRNFHLVWILR